ncbi:MAG TPA: lysophospholipid acyltransferase family protein, partial [Solirubrobacteraceae bacterium]|nr:lysophospholipid acyltransferase family protein [Solirubrobacteraceae bacterium]
MDRDALLARARTRGVNPLVYWIVRAVLQPFFHVYLRLGRIGREHIPASGPVILAANHRSFLDPFVIAVMARRPLYFMAKKELFLFHPVVSWLLRALGAFPIDRGASDQDAMATARAILERGDVVLMFPEGTRVRSGSLGAARRGVGRLALETGAPVVPVAVIGTEDVRAGWRIRPRRVRIRAGRALTFPRVPSPSPALAAAVTERIWPCVELQWEWLGGLPRPRRAAVIGAGPGGAGLAAALARAGLEVDLAAAAGRADRP